MGERISWLGSILLIFTPPPFSVLIYKKRPIYGLFTVNLASFLFILLAASVLKAVLRYGKKQFMVDETRRDTYKYLATPENESPVLDTIEEEFKQLIAV